MPYNKKQYDSARDFLTKGDDNVLDPHDKQRIQAYELYENQYINSTFMLKITLRGDDAVPLLMPSARKLVEAMNRFLAVNLDYLVEGTGDSGTQQNLEDWWKSFFARESVKAKFESNKRWGLVRGDSVFYLYADENKDAGDRISLAEVDARQVFAIEDTNDPNKLLGYHIVEVVHDFTSEDKNKQITKRRTFRKEQNSDGDFTGKITTELSFWQNQKWDDRYLATDELESVPGGPSEPVAYLPDPITQLPVYKWRTRPPQNSSWGTSVLSGLETLLYGINQSLTDEDATIVFQGLGMYMTNAAPPIDPNTNQVTDWNIGPMQIIEIGTDQKFERVSGVGDLKPYQDHMNFIDEKGLSEASGVPSIAIGKVDVSAVTSGIALKMELMPLIAANAELELEIINILDQLFHDITVMWLPAYEQETFGDANVMSEMSVVSVFDDPMPVDRDAKIQETILLQTSNLILTSMAIAKIRELGWKYPAVGPNGEHLTDDDIAQMLSDQASQAASAMDPFAQQAAMGGFDQAAGVPPPMSNVNTAAFGGQNGQNGQGNAPPSSQQVSLTGG